MVVLWLGIGVGIILVIYLLIKYSKTHKNEYVKFHITCVNCGSITNGLKCIKCENERY